MYLSFISGLFFSLLLISIYSLGCESCPLDVPSLIFFEIFLESHHLSNEILENPHWIFHQIYCILLETLP